MGCSALLIVHISPDALSFYELKEGRVHALVHLVNNQNVAGPIEL